MKPDFAEALGHPKIRPVADYWLISNFSRTSTYVAENLEGAGEFVKAAPGRLDMPVPFEFSRVILPGTEQPVSFRVTASQHAYADPGQTDGQLGGQTATPWPLDRTSRYFLVLVALCEPLLRDPSSTAMPTAAEIVRRLAGPGPNGRWTTTAVHDQINYLATMKLRVRAPDPGTGLKATRQREALVAIALRFNLVREEHLDLLPSQRI